ncbi:hypothetical protein ACX93W_05700 [Paenibacillus sp. CAU 1782]
MLSKISALLHNKDSLAAGLDKAGKWLRYAILALLAAIILSQLALQNETIREWLTSAARWEGTSLG